MKTLLFTAVVALLCMALQASPRPGGAVITEHHSSSQSEGSDGDGSGTVTTTKTETTTESDIDFEISDADFALLDADEIDLTSTKYSKIEKSGSECEASVKKLDYENEQLTKQLVDANEDITELTAKNTWLLKELDSSKDKYNEIVENFETLKLEIKIAKKKLQISSDDYKKVQTDLNVALSESQTWKSKFDVLTVSYSQVQKSYSTLQITVKNYETTITQLNESIEKTATVNKNQGVELNECNLNYQSEHSKVENSEKTITGLNASIDDLTKKNVKLTEDLSSSHDREQQNAVDIDTLKKSNDDIGKNLSACVIDKTTIGNALSEITGKYNAEQLSDHEELIARKQIESERDELKARNAELETNYQTEKSNAFNCQNDIASLRVEITKNSQQYELDIKNIRITDQASIDECKDSLKSETEKNVLIVKDNDSLKSDIADIQIKLTASEKATEDCGQSNKQYQDENASLNETIESFKRTIDDDTKQIAVSAAHSASLQSDLNECKSNFDECQDSLHRDEANLTTDEKDIVDLKSQIKDLAADKKECTAELSKLRCDANQFLISVQASEQKALKAAQEIVNAFGDSDTNIHAFIGANSITCEA